MGEATVVNVKVTAVPELVELVAALLSVTVLEEVEPTTQLSQKQYPYQTLCYHRNRRSRCKDVTVVLPELGCLWRWSQHLKSCMSVIMSELQSEHCWERGLAWE